MLDVPVIQQTLQSQRKTEEQNNVSWYIKRAKLSHMSPFFSLFDQFVKLTFNHNAR